MSISKKPSPATHCSVRSGATYNGSFTKHISERCNLKNRLASYQGQPGELWYVRLLPPLLPEFGDYHIVFTTPYILIHATKGDWLDFLKRGMLLFKTDDERQALDRLLKYGREQNFWNEFVLKAYHHNQPEAIFLAGIPDLKGTLPHA